MTTIRRRLGSRVDEGRGTPRVTKPSVFVLLALLSASLVVVDAAPAQAAAPGDVNTIAGTGTQGFSGDGGDPLLAELFDPHGIAVAADGTIYFADTGNFRIRKIDSAGVISTIAGAGVSGNSGDGGAATSATFGFLLSIALDPVSNTLYFTDVNSNRVRQIDLTTGMISAFAGTGTLGFLGDGGAATSARLRRPQGVAVAPDGSVVIADTGNCRIRRVSSGTIATIAGSGVCDSIGNGGPATAAGFYHPRRVYVRANGDVFASDANPNSPTFDDDTIRMIDVSTGLIDVVAGGGATTTGSGPATTMKIGNVSDITFDALGGLYIGSLDRVYRVDLTSGTLFPFAGTGAFGYSGDGGPAIDADFNSINAIAFDGDALIISDGTNNRLRAVSSSAPPAVAPPTFTGTDPVSPANDNNPRIIGTAAGAVTVTLYATADCSGSAAVQGSASDFASPGLPVSVADNSTTTFYGTATDDAANTSACSTSSITYVEDSVPADLVVTDCADPTLTEVTSIEGDLIIENVAGCEAVSLPNLTSVGGSVSVTGNTAAGVIDLGSLATVGGTVSVTGNTAAGVLGLGSLATVSGDLTLADTAAGVLDLGALATVGGTVTVTGNTAAGVLDLGSLATVSGDVTIVENGSATVNLAAPGTIGGDLTLESQGSGELQLPATSGDLSLDASGYNTISGATAGGTTSISNTDGQAVMRVVLPEGTFETPIAFTITMLDPATLLPEAGTGADGEAATVDPLAAYGFEFAVPFLGLDATLSFDVLLDSLDTDAQSALLAALDAGTATLVTKGGEAGDTYQAFPLCSGGAVPSADGCILVERLDADGQPTTGAPAIVRFTGVTGHFSTWGVAIVEPIPPPDPRTQLDDLLRDVEASSIPSGLRLDLANKLQAALKGLGKNPPDVVLACEKVAEFARKVQLESSRKGAKVPAATAAGWLAAVADIQSGLGC